MAKHDIMRHANFLQVFTNIRKNGPVTKKELQLLTGLSWGSISTITSELLALDILVQNDDIGSKAGRTAKTLDINPSKNLIIGIDINLQGITGVIIDMAGHTKNIIKEPLLAITRNPILAQTKQIICQLLDCVNAPGEIRGIGISFPGHVDQGKGTSIHIQHFDGFDNYPICEDLEAEFGYEVIIGHDTNCIAISEHMLGVAQDLDNFLLVRICQGIGMATVYNGQVFTGRNGATGEIGHVIMQPDGPRCQCGHNGCLETYASAISIVKQCREGLALGISPVLSKLCPSGETLSLSRIMEAVQLKDSYCTSVINRAAAYTGIAIANTVNILDPEVIVLCGSLIAYQPYLDLIIASVQKNIWRNDKVNFRITQHHHGVSAAVGIAAQFIEPVFSELINI